MGNIEDKFWINLLKLIDRKDLNQWLDDYYDERGWEIETGIPKKEKLSELDMDDVAEDMDRFR